ncbi:unnamed protein product [Closterium sp. NIES-54]
MYALTDSAEGDCYLSVPPDPGVAAAALGASASAAPSTSESAAPGAGDQPVAVSLADPSGGPVLAHSSTVLPPGSSLYTLTTAPPPFSASGQVAASSQVFAAASRSTPASAPCLCLLLSHETLLWHHRLGHPSLPRLRGMASRTLVSSLPRSLPPLPPGPAPTCVLCVEGWQGAAPPSSTFPPTEAPLQTLHMDMWAHPAQGEVPEVLIDWIRGTRHQLNESFGSDLPVMHLHSERGGEFSSDLLRAFCRAEGIHHTFTLPASPQQNGIAERRIGMVMDVARTSMIHAAAPHFLWPFAVQYAAHQINLQPRPGDAESGGAESGRAEPGGAEPGPVEPAGTASRGVKPACAERGGALGAAKAGAAGATGGAAGAGGSAGVRATGAARGAAGAGAAGATGGAAGTGDHGAEGTGSVSAVSGGAARPRPYYVPLLQQVLGSSPSPGPTPPFLSPPPVQSQSQLQPSRPVSPESHSASPVRTVRAGRVSRPPIPGTHSMTLRPSTAPQGVPLPSPPASSLPAGPDPASDSLRAASLVVTRFLPTIVTDPLFESTAVSALVTELVDFAAACRLDYATSLVAESASASVCPPSGSHGRRDGFLEVHRHLRRRGSPTWGEHQHSAQRIITLTQSHMVQQVLQRFGFTYSSPQSTPLPTGHSLSAPPSDESVEPSGPYPELVGCLMYPMTCTRPDLAYPLSLLACYVAPGRHRKVHWDAAKRVLRYLCSTSGMGLVLGGWARVVLTGHADASWVDDLATQRSSLGYTFSLGSGSISWRSTRSSSVLGSSCEAEIYAGAMAAQELRWLTYLLTDLGEAPRSPPVLYVDNKAMLALCQEHRLEDTLEHRTKHIALRYFLARELQQRGQFRLAYALYLLCLTFFLTPFVVPKYYSGTVIALPFSLQACSASGILWGGA